MMSSASDIAFFDSNVFIGRHENPYTESPFEMNTLIEAMNASGINGGLVYHSAAVLYDASFGNALLSEQIKKSQELMPVWVAVPEFSALIKDAKYFASQIKLNKISAVKIFPRYHNYSLITGSLDAIITFLNEERIPLMVNQEEISWDELKYILENYESVPLILQNSGYRLERDVVPFMNNYNNFYLDISRYQAHGGLEYLSGNFGSDHILFGSGMPVFSPEPIMMMIKNAAITEQEKKNISSQNILRLLNRD